MVVYVEISDRINDQNFGRKIEKMTNCVVILATEFATELFGRKIFWKHPMIATDISDGFATDI